VRSGTDALGAERRPARRPSWPWSLLCKQEVAGSIPAGSIGRTAGIYIDLPLERILAAYRATYPAMGVRGTAEKP